MRRAIDCLPTDTKRAMLDGVSRSRIIAGAYVDREGGVCPMLVAHRNGGRTSLASFARAWDRYTRAGKGPRPASERELRTLKTMLEASVALDDAGRNGDLAYAIAEHTAAKARRDGLRRDTGERNRTPELRHRRGWAWLRPFRRYDAYEVALQQLEDHSQNGEQREREPERELERV